MSETLRNAWDREVPPAKPSDPFYVDESDRVDDDSIDPDDNSNALDEFTGDDVGDLTVEDLLQAEKGLA